MTTIGLSDLDVAPLALGGNTFGWTSNAQESFAVLDEFVSQGGSLVDTADVYSAWAPGNSGGESEEIIGRWFARSRRRDDVVLATKVAKKPGLEGLGAQTIAQAADESLTRLGTDRIDLYYAHAEDPNTPVEESVAAFAALQAAGKVRHVALSNFSPEAIAAWVSAADDQGVARPVALQPHYNLVFRADYEGALREAAQEYSLGVIPYFSLASGFLTGKYHSAADVQGARGGMVEGYASDQAFAVVDALRSIAANHSVAPASVALAWLASQPTIAAPIASARTVEQLPSLINSLSLTLDPSESERLTSVSQGL
ncbi:aldo/keto reductase [Schaalia sp. ZJ1691]|uniref:aldo/keto reductase n=1 Tax=Schaalia sp. ZJ1691 TaxID=2709404 RepID=UPI0013EB39F2|nr:aldo/keto reductase [Schaalia sp. ZJ1691]